MGVMSLVANRVAAVDVRQIKCLKCKAKKKLCINVWLWRIKSNVQHTAVTEIFSILKCRNYSPDMSLPFK